MNRVATSAAKSFATNGSGDHEPIPPVLGPVSPSPTRFTSCAGGRQTWRFAHGFLAINGNALRRLDADAHMTTGHAEHRDGDVFTDSELLANLSGQYQHRVSPVRFVLDGERFV